MEFIPECDLKLQAAQKIRETLLCLKASFSDAFASPNDTSRPEPKPSRMPLPKASHYPLPIQEQEQEQEQKQERIETPALSAFALLAPFITLPLNDGSEFPIGKERVHEWQSLYPAIDVAQEIRNYRGWAINNPTNRKTRGGILKSVNSWLAKEQNQARPARGDQYRGDHHRNPNPSADREAINFNSIEAAGRNLRTSDGINEK